MKEWFVCCRGGQKVDRNRSTYVLKEGKLTASGAKRRGKSRRLARILTSHFTGSNKKIERERTCGVATIFIEEAVLAEEGSYAAIASIGAQSYLSSAKEGTANPHWGEGHHVVVQNDGPEVVTISIYKYNGWGSKTIVGVCDVDLRRFFEEGFDGTLEDCWMELKDPVNSAQSVGKVKVAIQASTLRKLEEQIWRRLMSLVDYNNDGVLQEDEFVPLIKSIWPEEISESAVRELFSKADTDRNGAVDDVELAKLLADRRGKMGKVHAKCPITGDDLPDDEPTALVYLHLCLSELELKSLKGGFKTAHEATRSWMLKLSEWINYGTFRYEPGLNEKGKAVNIMVVNRQKEQLRSEVIAPQLVMAMQNIYQTAFGKVLLHAGAAHLLQIITENHAKYMNSPDSVGEIDKFLESFAGVVDVNEIAEPLASFKTFNEFFVRKLKPGLRPIAELNNPSVLVSAADCRLMGFSTVTEASKFWIKGKEFNISNLLGEERLQTALAASFNDGAMAIFRLAPQDYHRFHFPVRGVLKSITHIPGVLYTVNPIAVSSSYANVFTENKRAVCEIESGEFGKVLFVVIGATIVGSINFTAQIGGFYEKGDEFGYFAFGGSTAIALFEKDRVVFDDDLVDNSQRSVETLVKMGEKIGIQRGYDD